jgi:deoxycytidylate deaminase
MLANLLKRKFLVLGFTGPLRSGCTTAAKFFSNNPQATIDTYCAESEQALIETTYKEIADLLRSASPNTKDLERKKETRKELLRTREIKKILSKNSIPKFHYISMSIMLLKYVIEYLLSSKTQKIPSKYQEIVGIIEKESFDDSLIKRMNEVISKKKYRELSDEECINYDNYLLKLEKLMHEIKNKIEHEKLGDILQDVGDNIRKLGNPFNSKGDIVTDHVFSLAEEANKIIKFFRNRKDKDRRIHHFAIECFRNPYEIDYFRYRYYEFYLISLFSGEKERQERERFSAKRDERDRGESVKPSEIYKQNVSRCVYFSDIAINNDSNKDDFYKKLLNYYALMISPGCITPTTQEVFMNQAYSLSLKSSCISHQVGAVIIGKDGYVVGAGWNDVGEGQIGCGYRQLIDIKSLANDVLPIDPLEEQGFRKSLLSSDYRNDDSFCYKDEYSSYKVKAKIESFMKERKTLLDSLGTDAEKRELLEEWLSEDIKIKRLEYCRALHAEENALLQSAKIGGMGVMGGTIYTTFFPCELCAKKIYQSGIKEIIYTEPYPESISCNVFLKDGIRKIQLTQFEGVKSHSYFRLYKASMDKKEAQQLEKIK